MLTAKKAFGWILLVGSLAHGLLPLSTIVISDDWFTLLANREGSVSAAWKGAVFLSMPLTVLQAFFFFLVGDNLFLLRAIAFAVLIGIGQMTYVLFARFRPAARSDALWVALFTVAFPGYLAHFMVSFLIYPLGLFFFLIGLWLVLCAEEEAGTGRRRLLFGTAAALVFYSFHFGVLLLFYGFFVAAHLYFRHRSGSHPRSWVRSGFEYLRTRYLFLILPFWFWGMRQAFGIFLPTWAEYNQPQLNADVINAGIAGFGRSYAAIGAALAGGWWIAAIAGTGGLLFARAANDGGRRSGWVHGGLAVLGLAILFIGILPFVLVGKFPMIGPLDFRGMTAFDQAASQILVLIDTRMHLFLGLAAGLILVAIVPLVGPMVRLTPRVQTAVFVACLAACVAADVKFYLWLEKRAIVMAGIREKMRENRELERHGVIGFVDRIGIVSTTWDSWVLFLETVWGDRSHHGVPERWYGSELNRRLLYDHDTVVNKGLYGGAWFGYFTPPAESATQATVVVSPGDRYYVDSDANAVFLHHFYRLVAPSRHAGFVKKFVRLAVFPKVNLPEIMRDGVFARDWLPLPAAEGPLSASTRLFRPLPGEGPHVVFEISARAGFPENIQFDILDEAGRSFAAVTQGGVGTVSLLARIAPDTKTLSVVVSGSQPSGFAWSIREARQQPIGDAGAFYVLPQPYLLPPLYFSDQFHGVLDIEREQMNRMVWEDGRMPAEPLFAGSGDNLRFNPSNPKAEITTDFVLLRPSRSLFLRVDWGAENAPSPGDAVAIEVVDDHGRKLLRLRRPAGGGVQIHSIPKEAGTARAGLRFSNPSSEPVGLPLRVTLLETPHILALKQPLESVFPVQDVLVPLP